MPSPEQQERNEQTEVTLQGIREWFPIIASGGALIISMFAAYANVTTRLSLIETALTGTVTPRLEAVESRQGTTADSIITIRTDLNVLNQRVTGIEEDLKDARE